MCLAMETPTLNEIHDLVEAPFSNTNKGPGLVLN